MAKTDQVKKWTQMRKKIKVLSELTHLREGSKERKTSLVSVCQAAAVATNS